MTPPKPSRRRLTQAEFDAEAARARGEMPRPAEPTLDLSEDGPFLIGPLRLPGDPETGGPPTRPSPYVTRTGRRRSWWQRGWKRG